MRKVRHGFGNRRICLGFGGVYSRAYRGFVATQAGSPVTLAIWVHLAEGDAIELPDTLVIVEPGDKLAALRGFGYTLAVFRDGVPIGHCAIEDCGYATVKEWLKRPKE